ncbi:hypothetical protein GCM10027190_59180 [Spirosoma areae]
MSVFNSIFDELNLNYPIVVKGEPVSGKFLFSISSGISTFDGDILFDILQKYDVKIETFNAQITENEVVRITMLVS